MPRQVDQGLLDSRATHSYPLSMNLKTALKRIGMVIGLLVFLFCITVIQFRTKLSPCGDRGKLGDLDTDFSNKIVIGQFASGTCGSYFLKRFERSDSSLTYIVRVMHPHCLSGPGRASLNLVEIEKPPQDTTIQFQVVGRDSGGRVELLPPNTD